MDNYDTYINSYSYSSGADETMLASVTMTVLVVAIILIILEIIGMWKMFKKAGKHGWASIIPIYNAVVMYQISGLSGWWVLALFVAGLVAGVASIQVAFSGFWACVAIAAAIFSAVISLWQTLRLAKAFKKSTLFTVGLLMFQPLFVMILGLGSSKYDKAPKD